LTKKILEAFLGSYISVTALAVTCHVAPTFRPLALQNKIECWSQK